jgi:hypothetical protein
LLLGHSGGALPLTQSQDCFFIFFRKFLEAPVFARRISHHGRLLMTEAKCRTTFQRAKRL